MCDMTMATNPKDLDKIRDLAQKRWNKIKNDVNNHSWCKEDALIYALEVYDEYYANRIEEDAIKAWKDGLKDQVTCDPMDCIFSVSNHDIKWLPEGRCQEIVKKLRSID